MYFWNCCRGDGETGASATEREDICARTLAFLISSCEGWRKVHVLMNFWTSLVQWLCLLSTRFEGDPGSKKDKLAYRETESEKRIEIEYAPQLAFVLEVD